MSVNNVGGINKATNIQQIKAADVDEYLNSVYKCKDAPKTSGDVHFTGAEKEILFRMTNCVIADEF